MSVRPYRDIARRKSRQIHVGKVPVGGDAPITVQSMTNTLTADAKATIDQVRQLEAAGADIVRVSCPDEESTAALGSIVREVKVPIVAVGGIASIDDVMEFLAAGATAVQIGTANFYNPTLAAELVGQLDAALSSAGCQSVKEFIGALKA